MVYIKGVKRCTLLCKCSQLNQEWLNIYNVIYGRKNSNSQVVEEEPEVEMVTKTKYIYEDTKCMSGVEPEYQWGEIYRLITRIEVLDMGLEEESIYANIERSSLMKIATRPEIFPCSKVIGWILPRADVTTIIVENVNK